MKLWDNDLYYGKYLYKIIFYYTVIYNNFIKSNNKWILAVMDKVKKTDVRTVITTDNQIKII